MRSCSGDNESWEQGDASFFEFDTIGSSPSCFPLVDFDSIGQVRHSKLHIQLCQLLDYDDFEHCVSLNVLLLYVRRTQRVHFGM
jgi:hypothetical protein